MDERERRKAMDELLAMDAELVLDEGRRERCGVVVPFKLIGSKWKMRKRIAEAVGTGRRYVEPFCGTAVVFQEVFGRFRIYVLNDLDDRVANFFKVLRDEEKRTGLLRMLRRTGYGLRELEDAIGKLDDEDEVTKAWAFFTASNMSHPCNYTFTAIRFSRTKDRDKPGMVIGKVKALMKLARKLRNAYVECRDWKEVVDFWDAHYTVFYLDPPYHGETRSKRLYRNEMHDHAELIDRLLYVKGKVVLSGLDNPDYGVLERAGWRKVEAWEGHKPTDRRDVLREILWIKD